LSIAKDITFSGTTLQRNPIATEPLERVAKIRVQPAENFWKQLPPLDHEPRANSRKCSDVDGEAEL
jgi:hypothetical protein